MPDNKEEPMEFNEQSDPIEETLPYPQSDDEKEILLCPFSIAQDGEDINCIEKHCAWWSKYHKVCAVHSLNEIPRNLFKLTQSVIKTNDLIMERM